MKNKEKDVYQEHGYEDRDDYLTSLSHEYDVPKDVVETMADLLGPEEDFDGLINDIEDYFDFNCFLD